MASDSRETQKECDMIITATDHWLAIDYKLPGSERIYNANPFVVEARKGLKPDATTAPFDTHLLEPGKTWNLPPGAQLMREPRVLAADND